MKSSPKNFIKFLLIIVFAFFIFDGNSLFAQGTPISAISASYVNVDDNSNDYTINGAGNTGQYPSGNSYNIFFSSTTTTDNDFIIEPTNSVTAASATFDFATQADLVFVRRVDNAAVTGIKDIIWAETESISGNDLTYRPSFIPSVEQSFNSLSINIGSDEFFVNTPSSTHFSNIERIDFIFQSGFTSSAPANSGFAVFERNGNDNFKIAAVTAIDASGNPTAFGSLVNIASSRFGADLKAVDYTIFTKEPGDAEFRPSQDGGTQQVKGVYVSLQDLGIIAGQPFYGYVLLPNDAVSTDFTLNPTNTAASNGGMDLLPGGAVFIWIPITMVFPTISKHKPR